MQSTVSVSKGCFIFKGSIKPTTKARKRQPKWSTSLLTSEYKSQRWYQAFTTMWNWINLENENLKMKGYTQTMEYLQKFVQDSWRLQLDGTDTNMPATALLTGINQPDHIQLFKTFAEGVRKLNNARVCIIHSRDCPTMKSAIETMVSGLMEEPLLFASSTTGRCDDSDGEGDDMMETDASEKRLRRSQYTMNVLKAWYSRKYSGSPESRPVLTVILPDFENFHRDILQQFILLLSHNYKVMPTALILGVATDLATLHRTLSFSDANRLNLQVSQSQPSTHSLSKILDEIILTPNCPITFSSKVYTLLTDIFLYYDLSINSFMQGIKYSVMEHYHQGNAFALCTTYTESLAAIRALNREDLDAIRRLPSFRRHVESINDCRKVIEILRNDEYLRENLSGLVSDIHAYLRHFYWALRVLLNLVVDLPKNLLGKQLRDLYAKCAANAIVDTSDFHSSWDLLAFMSKDELVTLLNTVHAGMLGYVNKYCSDSDPVSVKCKKSIFLVSEKLRVLIDGISTAGTKKETTPEQDLNTDSPVSQSQFKSTTKVLSRLELQAKLLEMAKQPKTTNAFTQSVNEALEFLRDQVLAIHLVPFKAGPPLLELFVFSDLSAIRSHIMGAPRAALHTGLHNPQTYLQCECCVIDNASQMTATLPDLSIVYKLHLESGHMINLFDWMQAFRSIVDSDAGSDDEDAEISPQIQARFTRAVAELQFLGFIKGSKRKTDHVARLTW